MRVSKDGTTAPLQTGTTVPASTSATAGPTSQNQPSAQAGVSKDGSTMPLANSPGGGNRDVATSQQDVQAQQKGAQTAAAAGQAGNSASGSSGYHSPEMMAAVDKARTLQAQGNEAGCMQAIQEAKRLKQ
jgi:hypothetical protein